MPGPGFYWIGEEEKREVLEVIESGHLFRYGSADNPKFLHKTHTFEREFAEYCGVKHALLINSGTSALWISLLAMGLISGDEVIVPAYTFVASYAAIIFAGGVPVLTEIDDSLTIDPEDIERRITPKTRAIMPVHMLGNPCDMDAIMSLARKHELLVLEDACQAAGGSYHGRKLGSIGRAGALSLNVFKTITTGDGGILITGDEDLYERAFALHDQGHAPLRRGMEVGHRTILGMNFRVNELLAAVALAQFRKLDALVATMHAKKRRFKELIADAKGFTFRTLNDPEGECATLCTVIFDDAENAARVSRALNSKTVDQSGWHVYANIEHVNRHLEAIGRPYGKGAYPRSDDLLSRAMTISIGVVDPGLGAGFGVSILSTEEEMRHTAEQFCRACAG
ncbi:MAG: DegT/DnrJ/EryC1/StrS family aminotransferase [Planctomycetia bacterium]|nr:DegT/DnrJ/EryC1/StrS family aminotransferase [Planctomycetia bacterium]